ncbi:MAG: hypothetical protein IBJ11_07520 [Phycisphaerales bacterium]|nr:hypothetical protein [Phycisphaerales bacterium]
MPRRLAMFAAACLLAAYVLVTGLKAEEAWRCSRAATELRYGVVSAAMWPLPRRIRSSTMGYLGFDHNNRGWWNPFTSPEPLLMLSAGAAALAPFGFLVLQTAVGRYRTSIGHVVRVAAYSAVIPCALMAADAIVGCVRFNTISRDPDPTGLPVAFSSALELARIASPVVAIVLVIVFWGLAVRRYLRLPHPWLVAISLGFISLLAAASAWWAIDGRELAGAVEFWCLRLAQYWTVTL